MGRGDSEGRKHAYRVGMTDENGEIDEDGIKQRWEQVGSKLDERGRRLCAASEMQAASHGALKVVSRITGLARSTINGGKDDLDEGPLPGGRVRRKGGGGRPLSERDPPLVDGLKRLVEPATLGPARRDTRARGTR